MKLSTEVYMAERAKLKEALKEVETDVNTKFNAITQQYTKDNSPVEVGKVYELANKSYKPRKAKRFAIYAIEPKFFNGKVMLVAGGWWLDETTNDPFKWHCYPVYGNVQNPTEFKLSDNQTNNKPK